MKLVKYTILFFFLFFIVISAQKYNAGIPKFFEICGYGIGDKPANYRDVVDYINKIASLSERVKIVKEGKTFQGRDLYYLIVTSPDNHQNIERIKENLTLLSDPRIKPTVSENELYANTPAVAFMMYSIHGNEASGTNASLKLLYELTANNGQEIKQILDKLIVIIYPMENPDGRMRFISQAEQWYGAVKDPDNQSYPHSGLWPSGRTNHYHFDLNRDWFILSQPESKARVKTILEWHPQLVIDAHEMGSFSTFLFNPPREPINPHMHKIIKNWWKVFTKDQASAFDEHGWSYYTREWLEEWYPGYGSSWPSYAGAVAILYEQARTAGTDIKRPDGTTLTYAQSVEHQFVSSVANLKTAAENKSALLKDYYRMKKEAINNYDETKSFIISRDKNITKLNRFISKLLFQKIEVYTAQNDFEVNGATNPWGDEKNRFSAGSIIIPLNQPMGTLVKAICEFDTRMTDDYLKSERKSILRGKGTRLYEVSAWSMPLAYGLNVYKSDEVPSVKMDRIESLLPPQGNLLNPKAKYGFVIPIEDENIYPMLNYLMSYGVKINVADKPFEIEGNRYERGTLLIRKNENPDLETTVLKNAAIQYGINIVGVNTALAVKGSDLGGGNFTLLTAPRTALIVGRNVSMNSFGSLWFTFDREIGLRVSKIDIAGIKRIDLNKYNVIILPQYYGSLKEDLGIGAAKLKEWVKLGGTLISMGTGSAAIADTSMKFGKVRLRRQVLKNLSEFLEAERKEEDAGNVKIDSLNIWEPADFEIAKNESKTNDLKSLIKFDESARKFSPQGVILSVKLNKEHWLNYGMPQRVPAFFSSSNVFMSELPVQTAARFDDFENLRLSGLLWPEARKRITGSAYLTRERYGAGQIILFAERPNFRSYNYGTRRLLLNAIFFGPGHGTRQKVDW